MTDELYPAQSNERVTSNLDRSIYTKQNVQFVKKEECFSGGQFWIMPKMSLILTNGRRRERRLKMARKINIEQCGNCYSLWINDQYQGVFETITDAMDAIHHWNRKIWPWKSLWDVEQEAGL